jgi:hypothetical protein
MNKSTIEFDIDLWSYVICYRNKKYVLNTLNIMRANELADIKLAYLKRLENIKPTQSNGDAK